MRNAQGATEYLLIFGVVVVVALLFMALMSVLSNAGQVETGQSADKFVNIVKGISEGKIGASGSSSICAKSSECTSCESELSGGKCLSGICQKFQPSQPCS